MTRTNLELPDHVITALRHRAVDEKVPARYLAAVLIAQGLGIDPATVERRKRGTPKRKKK